MIKDLIDKLERDRYTADDIKKLISSALENEKLIDFTLNNLTNDYLNQNENTVLKSLKEDNPPRIFLEKLLGYEASRQKRKKIISELQFMIKKTL
ncbi:hypothetical protein K9M79_03030 [Candidatus Woesearchaeota archaeon]|nr:hypothetical protein [Candidatus Woesearchaeota archaeon]